MGGLRYKYAGHHLRHPEQKIYYTYSLVGDAYRINWASDVSGTALPQMIARYISEDLILWDKSLSHTWAEALKAARRSSLIEAWNKDQIPRDRIRIGTHVASDGGYHQENDKKEKRDNPEKPATKAPSSSANDYFPGSAILIDTKHIKLQESKLEVSEAKLERLKTLHQHLSEAMADVERLARVELKVVAEQNDLTDESNDPQAKRQRLE